MQTYYMLNKSCQFLNGKLLYKNGGHTHYGHSVPYYRRLVSQIPFQTARSDSDVQT